MKAYFILIEPVEAGGYFWAIDEDGITIINGEAPTLLDALHAIENDLRGMNRI